MVITYRFGPCNCSAELVMDVRFITKKEDVVPCCPVGICPECGHTLTYAETIREVEPDPTVMPFLIRVDRRVTAETPPE